MPRQLPIVLQVLLLASLAIRLAVGAPCCWSTEAAAQAPHAEHMQQGSTGHHPMAAMEEPLSGHDQHGEGDNRAGPCCSACGPVLDGGEAPILAAAVVAPVPQISNLRDLPPRDLIRLYEATGPPLRV